jgi:copper chaperone
MSQTTLTVPEMSCEACRTTIEGALQGLPGVASVSVDLEHKLVRVDHDEARLPAARIADAIEEQGYEVVVAEKA